MLLGVIRTADERPRFDIAEAHIHADIVQLPEFIGMEEAVHRKMVRLGLEVLAQRQDIDFDLDKIGHDSHKLFAAFADAVRAS